MTRAAIGVALSVLVGAVGACGSDSAQFGEVDATGTTDDTDAPDGLDGDTSTSEDTSVADDIANDSTGSEPDSGDDGAAGSDAKDVASADTVLDDDTVLDSDIVDPGDAGGPDDVSGGGDTTGGGDTAGGGDTIAPDPCKDVPALTLGATVEGNLISTGFPALSPPAVCPDTPVPVGGPAARLWSFTATAAGDYEVLLETDGWDGVVYALSSCESLSASTCLSSVQGPDGVVDERLTLSLDAGQRTFILVDAANIETSGVGAYRLVVREPCTPACNGAVCGSDGCGGTCGVCLAGESCDDGGCTAASGACFAATEIGCNETLTSLDAGGAAASAAFTSVCDSVTAYPGNEVTVAFTAPYTGKFSTYTSYGPDQVVHLFDGTSSGSCIGATCLSEDVIGVRDMVEGQQFFLVVDSTGTTSDSKFSLTTTCCKPQCQNKECGSDGCYGSCGTCSGGATCVDGTCESLPTTCEVAGALSCNQSLGGGFIDEASTSAWDGFDFSCPNAGTPMLGPDRSYTFSAAKDTQVHFDGVGGDLTQTVYETTDGCDGLGECIAGTGPTDGFLAKAGKSYLVVFDTSSAAVAASTPFDLHVSCCVPTCKPGSCSDGCGGSCACDDGLLCNASTKLCTAPDAGMSCTSKIPLPSGYFSYSGTTAGFASQYTACDGSETGTLSREVIFEYVAPKTGEYVFAWNGPEMVVSVSTACADVPEWSSGCVASHVFSTDSSFTTTLTAGTAYTIVVDGTQGDGIATFTLTVLPPT